MQPGLNIEEIKSYNASLREYKEKSTKLQAEIEFNQNELNRQCKELSTELGIEVTPDNLQSILNDKINKINNTMQIGNEILARIKAEEAQASMQVTVTPPTTPTIPQPSGVVTQQPMPDMESMFSQQQVGFPNAQSGVSSLPGDLPPIFKQG